MVFRELVMHRKRKRHRTVQKSTAYGVLFRDVSLMRHYHKKFKLEVVGTSNTEVSKTYTTETSSAITTAIDNCWANSRSIVY